MKRIFLVAVVVLVAIGVLFLIGRSFVVTTDYSGVCTRCLQEVSGLDKTFLGFRYFHEEHLVFNRARGTSITGEQLPPIDPHTYEEIFGKPCVHHFIRLGFGRYQGGVISDGGYSKQGGIDARLALVEQLFLAFQRIHNRELAQQSYALIDKYYPEVTEPSADAPALQSPFQADSMPDEPMSILLRGLPLIRSESDWKAVIDAAEARNGNIELLTDRDLLIGRLKDIDPTARAQALHSLATRNDPESWEAIAGALGDPQIGSDAARQIVWNKHFEHYDRVMDIWERAYSQGGVPQDHDEFDRLGQSLTDAEVMDLLKQQKPSVDRLCFRAIELNNRFSFLEELVAVLNQRPSPEAEGAIQHLLAGPYPDLFRDEKTKEPVLSQWQALQDLYPNRDNPGDRIEKTNTLLRDAFRLGWSKEPGTWEKWRTIFESWWNDHASEVDSAAFAEAMYSVDPDRTVEYLTAQLKNADDSWSKSPSHILAAMGIIASPQFLSAVEEFKKKSVGTNYDKNPYYSRYVEYAEHRCRQIQLWRLVRSPNDAEKFIILRPDGTSIGSSH